MAAHFKFSADGRMFLVPSVSQLDETSFTCADTSQLVPVQCAREMEVLKKTRQKHQSKAKTRETPFSYKPAEIASPDTVFNEVYQGYATVRTVPMRKTPTTVIYQNTDLKSSRSVDKIAEPCRTEIRIDAIRRGTQRTDAYSAWWPMAKRRCFFLQNQQPPHHRQRQSLELDWLEQDTASNSKKEMSKTQMWRTQSSPEL